MCDAEAKTGSAAGTRQAAAPGVPNSKLAGEGKGHINAAGGECMKSATVYEYDRQLRPGTIGVDFESDNKNEEYTLRYEPEDYERMGRDIAIWLGGGCWLEMR